jgi:type IV pilus assembly protein PilY1
MTHQTSRAAVPRASRIAPLAAALACMLGLPVHSAVSIPDTPLQVNNSVAPNIMLILDDSGSMTDDFIPDGLPNDFRRRAYNTNTIYYNPNTTYQPWQQADGTRMADTPYTAAFTDANRATGGTVDLGNNADRDIFVPLPTMTNPADATQYTRYRLHRNGATMAPFGAALIVSSCPWDNVANNFADPATATTLCTRNFASFIWPSGVTRTIAQEKQNYATWFSYHRTRMKVAKASTSTAFNDPTIFNAENEFRVGYRTIHNRGNFDIPVGTNNGIFTGGNRTDWFNRLFNAQGNGNTPTSNALYSAGQYFMQTGAGGPWGPQPTAIQFQCRQNFAILTTDGYRNQGALAEVGTFPIGNEDATNGPVIDRPDGASYQYTPAMPYSDAWSDTLADVAMAYWKRDLRPDLTNVVPTSASNPAFWQHMVTFGISIGLRGTLDPNTSLPGLTSGSTLWPQPFNLQPSSIDDLWHATLNGRGTFVTATNPQELSDGLGSALRAISERRGSGSNASVSSTSTSSGSELFQAAFFSARWYGELQSFNITATGVSATPNWTAVVPSAGRNIFTYSGNVSSPGTTFPTTAQVAALGTDIAVYVAGDRTREEPVGPLRSRTSLLADIVNSSPAYLKTSSAASSTVFVGANGGMLHAFSAVNGVERFAYVPGGIDLDDLREFSEPDYGHKFFVDGPLVLSNASHFANRTALVGTLGRGGKGLFALDVTNPASFGPANVLWDRTVGVDNDMGLVLGKPVIAKLNNGGVGVIVSNGVNSVNERAVLYVYDLLTGTQLRKIDTNVGGNNGLSAPRGWDEDANGTVDFIYAGDLRGNVWKFDLQGNNPGSWTIAANRPFYSPSATPSPQPITGGISIALDPVTLKRWVFFGSGSLLSKNDLTNDALQSWYGIIDDAYTSTTVRSNMTGREITDIDIATGNRAFQANGQLPANTRGWFIDLDRPPGNLREGERMVGEPQVIEGILIASSVIPNTSNPCFPGRGYINAIDAFTGTSLPTGFFDYNRNSDFSDDTLGGKAIGSVDLNIGMVTDPAVLDRLLVAGGSIGRTGNMPVRPRSSVGRISWREVIRN